MDGRGAKRVLTLKRGNEIEKIKAQFKKWGIEKRRADTNRRKGGKSGE